MTSPTKIPAYQGPDAIAEISIETEFSAEPGDTLTIWATAGQPSGAVVLDHRQGDHRHLTHVGVAHSVPRSKARADA